MTTTTVGDRGEHTFDHTYVIGKEEKNQDLEGDQHTTSVKWEDKTLVFESLEKEKDAVLTSKEVWTISDDGKALTKSIHGMTLPADPIDAKAVSLAFWRQSELGNELRISRTPEHI